MPHIAGQADVDMSSSPSEEVQRSPPRLPNCSPHANPGDFTLAGGNETIGAATGLSPGSGGSPTMLYSATPPFEASAGDLDLHMHVKGAPRAEQDATLRSPRLASAPGSLQQAEEHPQRSRAAAAAAQGGAQEQEQVHAQSAVCLSEHPPGFRGVDPEAGKAGVDPEAGIAACLLYTSPSPRD